MQLAEKYGHVRWFCKECHNSYNSWPQDEKCTNCGHLNEYRLLKADDLVLNNWYQVTWPKKCAGCFVIFHRSGGCPTGIQGERTPVGYETFLQPAFECETFSSASDIHKCPGREHKWDYCCKWPSEIADSMDFRRYVLPTGKYLGLIC